MRRDQGVASRPRFGAIGAGGESVKLTVEAVQCEVNKSPNCPCCRHSEVQECGITVSGMSLFPNAHDNRILLRCTLAYVAVSRGAHDAQIFTNDREKLPTALGHEVSQQSAHAPQVGVEKGVTLQQDLGEKMKPQSVPEQEISHGFSIGR